MPGKPVKSDSLDHFMGGIMTKILTNLPTGMQSLAAIARGSFAVMLHSDLQPTDSFKTDIKEEACRENGQQRYWVAIFPL